MRALNRNVLAPWSEVELRSFTGQGVTDAIGLAVPKRAIPTDAGPSDWDQMMKTERIISVDELPGLDDGLALLRRRFPVVAGHWDRVKGLLGEYEADRNRRRELLEPMVTKAMEAAYPNLKPHTQYELKPDSYFPLNIVIAAEENGYYRVDAPDREITVTRSQQQIGQDIRFNLDDGQYRYPLIFGVSQEEADRPDMKKILTECVENLEVKHCNEEMRRIRTELEEPVSTFRKALKEAVVKVEVEAS